MRQRLDRFILGFPVLFLKQYPYAWIVAVALWPYSPSVAAVFLGIVVIGILSLMWQSAAWISEIRDKHAGEDGKFYVDQPPIPWRMTARNIALLVAGSGLIAYFLKGQLGLTFWQYFIIFVGFSLFYRDTLFFGAAVTYIITATGIALRLVPGHLDYRLFLPYNEIGRIERRDYEKGSDIDLFARTQNARDGLLMIPKDPAGFTKRIGKIFIAPADIKKFIEQLPYGYGKTS